MFARAVILALSIATLACAQPMDALAQPTTAPSLNALVFLLANRDPAIREQARDRLMQLTRADLPALAEAARGRPLLPTQRSLLHDIVVHVYLTGKHDFTGDGSGYLGITAPASVAYTDEQVEGGVVDNAQAANGEPVPDNNAEPPAPPTRRGAVVQSRTPGCDAYRVLEIGDVITAVSRSGTAEGKDPAFVRVTGFSQLRPMLETTRTGDWITLRILRNGEPREVRVRLARRPPTDMNGNPTNEVYEGEDYWKNTFERARNGPPSTAPATRRSKATAHEADEHNVDRTKSAAP
jgi:hypothetical protein